MPTSQKASPLAITHSTNFSENSKTKYNLALITGASSGLGKALCHLLASKGISLIKTGRTASEVEIPVDLRIKEERAALLDLIEERKPDLIINNAGLGFYGDAILLSLEEQRQILSVNCEALMEITLVGARTLHQANQRGTILNVSSAAAFFPFPTFSAYAASKAFVNQFSQALDAEMSPFGIRILTACPGGINTSFALRASKQNYTQKRSLSMSPERAAILIYRQIEKGKRLYIFDWRTRLGVYLSRLFPQRFIQKILRSSLSKRHKRSIRLLS